MEQRQQRIFIVAGGSILLLALFGIWWLRSRDPGVNWQGGAVAPTEEKRALKTSIVSTSTKPSTTSVVYPKDTDHDGVSDADEAIHGTDPNNPDTDHDGYTDFQEIFVLGSDPKRPDPPRPYPGAQTAPPIPAATSPASR